MHDDVGVRRDGRTPSCGCRHSRIVVDQGAPLLPEHCVASGFAGDLVANLGIGKPGRVVRHGSVHDGMDQREEVAEVPNGNLGSRQNAPRLRHIRRRKKSSRGTGDHRVNIEVP